MILEGKHLKSFVILSSRNTASGGAIFIVLMMGDFIMALLYVQGL